MHRPITYSGQVPLSANFLNLARYCMKGFAWLTQGVFGTATFATDITVVPNTPAALSVVVNPGQIFSLQQADSTNYSDILTDSHQIMKQGILEDATVLGITPPGSNSQIYLIQAAFSEVDAGSTVLPYYNPLNPTIAFSGPTGGGAAQFTRREGRLLISAKPGTPAASPTAPAPDAGYIGLYTVTVGTGATTISAGNITRLTTAPLLTTYGTLPKIPEGVQRGFWIYGTDTGSANAMVVNDVVPAITSYSAGQGFRIKAGNTVTGATTVNISGIGTRSVKRTDGNDLVNRDILTGQISELVYDGTNFQLIAGALSSQPDYTKKAPAFFYAHGAGFGSPGSGGTGQVIAASTWTKINMSTEDADIEGWYNPSTSRYTPLKPGFYFLAGDATFGSGPLSPTTGLRVAKNGTPLPVSIFGDVAGTQTTSFTNGSRQIVSGATLMNGTTDFLELFAFQDSLDSNGERVVSIPRMIGWFVGAQ